MSEILNELKWKKFKVLDDGFICLVDVMGNDSSVVQAARVSYGEGTKKVSTDKNLIRYLMRHYHFTPFEMAELKFLVRVPMDCWRQWIRHRMANVNEYSTRYSLAIDASQTTKSDEWRIQAKNNKQGSDGFIESELGNELTNSEKELQNHARSVYNQRLEHGVAREQARKDLPLSTYTEAYWKIDLRNLLNFLNLRMDSHAQLEIRKYAETIGYEIVKPLFPIVWEAFLDYQFHSVSLSRIEIEYISKLIGKLNKDEILKHQPEQWSSLEKCRERDEFFEKLKKFGAL